MSAREPNRLGRGLAALIGEASKPVAEAAGVRTLPIEVLDPSPFQPRRVVAPEALAELTASIRSRGLLQPLLARPDPANPNRYQIVAGERRWRAAQAAGLHEVPVVVRAMTDLDTLAAALVENLQRQDLNAAEEAEGYRRLSEDFKQSQETIAEAVGKSRSHVANTIRLLNLPETVLTALRRGAISAGHARALLALADPETALRIVIAKGLNVRQTEALSTNQEQPSGDGERPGRPGINSGADLDTRALVNELSEKLGMKVEVVSRGRGGVVKIHYRTLDQLDAFIARLPT